jgi:DNA (cytosine-5)-methyltransferase 1
VVRPNEKGGAGYLGYEDKTFTIATSPDQWICTPIINSTSQPIPMNEPEQPAPVGRPIRYLSVCSGMEAASVAWHHLGWTPVGFSEIEPFPCAILKHRFPNTPNYGSLTEYTSWPIEPGAIDLLVGGTPCQSFSVAGLRKGLADPRGNLALTFLGLADKLKPRWIVWENVPGVLSSGGGRDFGSFLGALVELGYGFAYRILDAQYVGGPRAVPQRRRRVFVVACLGDWRAPAEVLSLREGLRGYLETGNKKRKSPAADAGASVEASGLQRTVGTLCADTHPGAYSGQDAYTGRLIPAPITQADVAGPLDAHYYKGPGSRQGGEREYVAQPIPQPKPIVIDRAAFNQGQNAQYEPHIGESEVMDSLVARGPHAVGVPVAIQGTIIGRGENAGPQGTGATEGGPMFTLTKTDIHGVCHQMPGSVAPTIGASGPPYSRTGNERVEAEALAITFTPHIVQASELRLRGQITEQDTCPTLLANTKSGDNDPLAVQAITFQPGNLRREAEALAVTLNIYGGNKRKDRPEGNMYVREEDTTKCLDAANGLNPTCSQGGTAVLTPMAVRRLTPVECERLQGFPDNWSRISWKGKPEEQCPDGPRYKACGNSMAVPVMRWIGERIAAVDSTISSHA